MAEAFDRRLERLAPLYAAADRSLAVGFRLSVALLAVGLALSLVRDEKLHREVESLPEILSLVADGHGAGFVDLAIVAMVMTPIATVLVLAAGFLRIGDRRYALVSCVVLAILGVSIAVSLLR
jgi:uncharacterized membrane protein